MKLKFLALFIGLNFALAMPASADETVYDLINNEDMDAFSDLVAIGYDIDEQDADGFSPLMVASALGKEKFVRFLVHNNANVNKRSYAGLTAMHRAAQAGHNNIIDVLISAGANVNIPDFAGNTPLMYAVASERRFTVERLVALGSDVNFINAKGETALQIAQRKRFKEIYDFLKSKGAK